MRHFIFLLMCVSILLKGNVKRPCYGFRARNELHALCAKSENVLKRKKEEAYSRFTDKLKRNIVT